MEIELISTSHLATLLGVSTRTLERWHKDNCGPPRVKIGRQVGYLRTTVCEWLQSCETRYLVERYSPGGRDEE
jgi:predicted DNA-binding transcriptional regulator AlpA